MFKSEWPAFILWWLSPFLGTARLLPLHPTWQRLITRDPMAWWSTMNIQGPMGKICPFLLKLVPHYYKLVYNHHSTFSYIYICIINPLVNLETYLTGMGAPEACGPTRSQSGCLEDGCLKGGDVGLSWVIPPQKNKNHWEKGWIFPKVSCCETQQFHDGCF